MDGRRIGRPFLGAARGTGPTARNRAVGPNEERCRLSLDPGMDIVVEGDLLADERDEHLDLDKLEIEGHGFRWIAAIRAGTKLR